MENTKERSHRFEADILREVGEVPVSRTQKFRVLMVKDPDLGVRLSAQKWWRKDVESDWQSGKGFFLTGRQAMEMGRLLVESGREILHVR